MCNTIAGLALLADGRRSVEVGQIAKGSIWVERGMGPMFDDDGIHVGPLSRGSSIERRLHERLSFSQMVRVETTRDRCLADLVEMSSTGARIQAPFGVPLDQGQTARLTLLDGTHLRCRIVWSGRRAIGVRFEQLVATPLEHLDPEHLGRDFFARILEIQNRRARAAAFGHSINID